MLTLLILAFAAAGDAPAPRTEPLRLNDIQVLGSHNSYKDRIPPVVLDRIRAASPQQADALDYHHGPIIEQLDAGLRQLEIDIFADPEGGRYSDPSGERLARAAGQGTSFDAAAMRAPGFKVLHVPDVDYNSHCATLIACLRTVDDWSRRNPGHLPLMLTINAHDWPIERTGITDPIRLDGPLLDALDAEIRSVFDAGRIITPDDVRGDAATLREAVLANRWPTLDEARGKVFLLFDVRADIADRYRAGHPSLAGRAMFAFYDADQPESATIVVQDPIKDGDRIRDWVRAGFIARTRADADTVEARSRDGRKAAAAAASGAQAISTDYYPGSPDPGRFGFVVTLPEGAWARCNPIRRDRSCRLNPPLTR